MHALPCMHNIVLLAMHVPHSLLLLHLLPMQVLVFAAVLVERSHVEHLSCARQAMVRAYHSHAT